MLITYVRVLAFTSQQFSTKYRPYSSILYQGVSDMPTMDHHELKKKICQRVRFYALFLLSYAKFSIVCVDLSRLFFIPLGLMMCEPQLCSKPFSCEWHSKLPNNTLTLLGPFLNRALINPTRSDNQQALSLY